MKKFLFILLLIIVGSVVLTKMYKGRVAPDEWGVLLRHEDSGPKAVRADGLVFNFGSATLHTYPKDLGYTKYDGKEALRVRSRESVVMDLPIGFGMRSTQAGSERLCQRGIFEPKGHLFNEVRGKIMDHALALAAELDVDKMLADPGALIEQLRVRSAKDLNDLGVDVLSFDPLGTPQVTGAVQGLLSAEYTAGKQAVVAGDLERTAVALQSAIHARLQMQLDSSLAMDLIARKDSIRSNLETVERFKRDSTVFKLKYTAGYLENKRLEMVGRAVDKWDGRLNGPSDPMRSPFDRLGVNERQAQPQATP